MANLNIKIDFTDEIETSGYLYKDLDIKFEEPVGTSPSSIAQHIDIEAIQQGIRNIFNWSKGERILIPDFGSNLKIYLHEGITEKLKSDISSDITKSITTWEPRVNIKKINVYEGGENDPHSLFIEVFYTIPSLNEDVLNFQTTI